ncbi:PREDICTED: 2-oxoglutarate and iron-dependent oxygenase domain-containing protein 3-like isoform X2 [Priapulus caudatus]|uniref:2-oxoglutarate and iron-dependent oxygenase domain-containing protein 3-like isoform X2 n=1 Tax=Priapulus caudatus TaxID=37621 RepID=A0ABM1EGR6_PRICU|nr:PREDICTED: 2-oxoglutarate and iron-dependent oxygenase domain-containing protein 3-like isoform X2 [Priapulus caudatus]
MQALRNVGFHGCAPKRCGRVVMDGLVTSKEAEHLVELVESALSYGGSTGGASILDLHSGAMSKGNGFVNIYSYLKKKKLDQIFTDDDFLLYTQIKNRIRQAIATEFGILQENLYLTKPTFFSRMTNATAKTIHDEYWHVHVDKETYGSFFYTSLLYLTNHNIDYTGGRFIFNDADANRTVEPRTGRVSFFTSGSENPHFVEKVTSGTRYAVTVSFTCDKDQAIRDPTSEAFQD